jgi:hypothetical protein
LARATPDKLKDIAGVEPGEVDLAAAKSAHQELSNKRGIADACGWCERTILLEVKVVLSQHLLDRREGRLRDPFGGYPVVAEEV